MKLSLKIFIIILAISTCAVLIMGLAAYFNIREEITGNVVGKLDAIVQIQKNRLQDDIDGNLNLLSLFNTEPLLRSYLAAYDKNPTADLRNEMDSNIQDTIGGSSKIINVSIVTPRGVVASSTDKSLPGKNISTEDFFKVGIKNNDVSFLIKNDATNKIDRYLVGPLELNGKIIGMTILVTSTDNIVRLVNDYTGLGNTGETLLARRDSNGDALFLAPVRFDKNAALTRIVEKENTNVPSVSAVNGKEITMTDAVDYRGVPVFAATRYIKSVGWGIVVKINQSEALAPVVSQEFFLFIILLIVIVLVVVFTLPVTFSIVYPLRKLASSAKKISEGDLSLSFKVRSKDEIGALSASLEDMVANLRDLSDKYRNLNVNLEKEVNEKTSRLEDQNAFLSDANKAMLNLSEDLEKEKGSLELSKINMEAVLGGIGDALIATDSNGIINVVNAAAEKMLGYKASEIIGKSVFSAVTLEDEGGEIVQEKQRPIFISFSKKKLVSSNYYCVRKNKTKFISAITSSPVILGGNVIGAVDILRDVTKEKEIDKEKTEFVSLASHQLRTPATAVKWYSEMLMDKKIGKLSSKQKKYINQVYHGNERMIKLIDNLLNISRMEMGKLQTKNELVDVKKLFEDIVFEQKSELKRRKHKLVISQEGGKIDLSTDPFLIKMVLQNFISNAVKYTNDKGKIVCNIKKEGSKVLFSVEDNGVGIPKDEHKKIFQRFYRASNALALDREGNGLGLYLAKQIAETLGGKIWFESKENKGSTFYLELPMANKV